MRRFLVPLRPVGWARGQLRRQHADRVIHELGVTDPFVDQAFARGRVIYADPMTASEIEFTPAIAAHIEVLESDPEPADARELEPA